MDQNSVLGRAFRGAAAGALGTLAMDTFLYTDYKSSDGKSSFIDWETSKGLDSWDDAPAPARIGRKIATALMGKEPPAEVWARPLNTVMHWSYGLLWGALYGVLRGNKPGSPIGIEFGTLIWASDYVILPLAGVYEPIWQYDFDTLSKDWMAHVVFGVGTASTLLGRPKT